jgi:limonene-1,2-epoxide hydrolase
MKNTDQIKSQGKDNGQELPEGNPLTTAQENIELIRTLFRALDTPGLESEETIRNILDENVVWHAVPYGRTFSGRDEVIAVFKQTWETSVPDHPITHIFADAEWVCLEYVLASTKKAGRMLFHEGDAVGGKLNVPAVSIYHMTNGKLDIAREYLDVQTLRSQLGVDPTAAPSSKPV